jgi:hypothetical protein
MLSGSGQSLWGHATKPLRRVSPAPRRRRLRNGYTLPIEPRHHFAQRPLRKTSLPELAPRTRPAELAPMTTQMKGEAFVAILQVPPPASRRAARWLQRPCARAQRGATQQQRQHRRLRGPGVPASRRQTLRQHRTGLPTAAPARTDKARDRDRVELTGIAIGLALIVAMRPQPSQPASRTACRSIRLRPPQTFPDVLFQRGDRRHNARHKAGFFRCCERRQTTSTIPKELALSLAHTVRRSTCASAACGVRPRVGFAAALKTLDLYRGEE